MRMCNGRDNICCSDILYVTQRFQFQCLNQNKIIPSKQNQKLE